MNRSRIARRLAEIVWEIERLKQTVRAKYLRMDELRKKPSEPREKTDAYDCIK